VTIDRADGIQSLYGRMIGYPELKPHDLRHGVAMEVLEQHHDLEQVRALLGHARIDTTQVYASVRPPAEESDVVLRGAGGDDARRARRDSNHYFSPEKSRTRAAENQRVRMSTRSGFEEHSNAPKTREQRR